jgi:predicted nucleic acid-binding Zn ribbon protein
VKPSLRKRVLREWRPFAVEPPPPAPSLERLMPDVMKRLGLEQRLWESQIFHRWADIVGEFNARICQPIRLAKGKLTVAVTHPAYLQELRPHKALMLRKVQERLGANCVRDIILCVG